MPGQTPERFARPHYLIETFTRHPLASNLLMLMLILAGIWGIRQLNIQLNPNQPATAANVEVSWPGTAAEDVERLVTQPLEYQLRSLTGLDNITSSTFDGGTRINLDFGAKVDMGDAIDRIKARVGQTRDLPPDIETPVVRLDDYMETVAAILISGEGSLDELIPTARDIERDLVARGADRVEFGGIPAREIAIQVDSKTLFELGVPLQQIAQSVMENSRDVPAGSIGGGQLERQLRALEQRRTARGFEQLPIVTSGELQYLGDIAHIERRAQDDQRLFYYQEKPAIMLRLRRAPGSDTMDEANILRDWMREQAPALAQQGVETRVFLEAWRFAKETLMLVVGNGFTGLLLVIATLFVFLNGRVASWVTVGIPVSFLGALAVFHFLGGTINFISLIGVVMALGIVVDDAIVVGEHALSQFEKGRSPSEAAALGAQRMFAPVMASSLTTLAAFLPLIVLEDAFITEIPLLMLCVIIASLVECFLIMPGHLRHSFERMEQRTPSAFRRGFDARFTNLRDQYFSPLLTRALDNRRAVLALAVGAFVVALTLLASGRVKPELNLNVDFEFADAYLQFSAGATEENKAAFMRELEEAAMASNKAFGGNVVITHVQQRNWAYLEQSSRSGSQYAAMWVELVPPDQRSVTLAEFSADWQARLAANPFVETLQFEAGEDSYPDIQLYFSGADVHTLKLAAEELASRLATYPGVNNVFDDLPYGKEQWLFNLTTEGRAAGLTSAEVGRQIHSAFEGYRVQLFTENDDEVEVRVSLPVAERMQLATLHRLPITTATGEVLPLASVANISARRGIERINHRNGQKAINVFANVDRKINTPMAVISDIEEQVIPDISQRYGVNYGLGERSAEEAKVLGDMLVGALIGLTLIYLILAWVFASWTWPLAVMIAIPLGLTGAIAGLQIMGLNLGVMAIMGLFTLTGVIVNDSIILITAYKAYRMEGRNPDEALHAACTDRLRPVILTSLTTTLGLAPMMLESSPMGEAMAPLAVVICFGLLYGTTLILLTVPAVLSVMESMGRSASDPSSEQGPTIQSSGSLYAYHHKD